MDLSIKLSVPVTVALVGSFLGTINSNRQNEIAQANQKDAVVREYIKEMKGILLDKAVADEARKPGTGSNGVARALTLTALTQLKGDGPERRSLVFQFLRESNFSILKGSGKQRGANLSAYDLREANLREANLSMASLSMASLTDANLYMANLREAVLIGADLSRADLIGADLSRADLIGANLNMASLREANLSEVHLTDANLYMANLKDANLSRSILWNADLSRADLSKANLSRADLSVANLSRAILWNADLSRADLTGAKLIGADLGWADLQDVQWDDNTIWPSPDRFKDAKNIPPALKKQLGL